MNATDLCYAGAAEQARRIQSGATTATELIKATLNRINTVDRQLNSYREVLADRALDAAAHADSLLDNSTASSSTAAEFPLLGVPVAIKDTVAVSGEVTSFGTSGNHHPALEDDPVVASLKDAGAIIIGITTCSELAVWPFTETKAWGDTRNPWNTKLSPGGSSGGAGAAVAAGLCGLALGSDGLGSIRVPAGFTGVFGLKPQRGRVWHDSRDWQGMSVNGPLARNVADAALFLDATSVDPTGVPANGFAGQLATPLNPLRIAVAWKPVVGPPATAKLGDDQRSAVVDMIHTLRDLGHTVIEQEFDFDRKVSSSGMIRYLSGIAQSVDVLDNPDALSKRTRAMATYGRLIPNGVLRRTLGSEAESARRINGIFDTVDIVVTPGATQSPIRVGSLRGRSAMITLNVSGKRIPYYGPWNVIGQPAASVPAGFDSEGMPVSVQLCGRPHDETTLLQLAAQIEQAKPWAGTFPPVD